jgi:DNA-binding NtrC family response regulator
MNDTKPSATVLIISNDRQFRSNLNENLLLQGFTPLVAATQAEALALLEKKTVDIVFLDIESMPALEMDIVNYIRLRHHAEIVVLTTIHEIEEATNALKNGAAFYLGGAR